MKTPRFQISIVMAAAIGTFTLILNTALAEPLKKLGRFRSSEREATDLTSIHLRQHRSAKMRGPAIPVPVPPEYPRYRLIDLGTLGGANSLQVAPAVSMNNRGDVIAQASTGIPDPLDPSLQDGFIWHADK